MLINNKKTTYTIVGTLLMFFYITACADHHDISEQQEANIPVKIFAGMKLGSLLNEPVETNNASEIKNILPNKWYAAIQVKSTKDTNESYSVDSCDEYFKHQSKDLAPVKENEINAYSEFVLMCKAAKDILKATPAKSSFLNDLQFDKKLPDKLPKQFAMITSTTEHAKIMADKQIRTWAEVNKITSVEIKEKHHAIYKHDSAQQEIELIASGDFNKDGYEDALISTRDSVENGSYNALRIYGITKTQQDGLYEINKKYSY